MEEMILKLKQEIIEVLNLEDINPEDIDNDAPLFGEGLGLDSIDAWSRVRRSTASSCRTLQRERRFSSQST
mgnify:CR=1 FL=1